jgi:hypothetical protein
MAIITWPTNLIPAPGSGFGQRRYDVSHGSDTTGARQDRVLAPPRWQLSIVQPELLTPAQAGRWHALVLSLRGRVNHLACWDFGRPVPLGTLRGTPTLGAAAAAGATSIAIAGGGSNAGATLRAGDMLQLGTGLGTSQVVMVMADATADGSGNIAALSIEPPLRVAQANGNPVTWQRPLAYFKLSTGNTTWSWESGPERPYGTGLSLDLLEYWS